MIDEMNHTPAPWRVQTFAALDGYEVVSDSWDVVSASLRPAAPIRKLSDARLIAAAPDLLTALIEARHALQFANDSPGGPIVGTIRMMHSPGTLFDFLDAAIAKATGGEG